ncbi:hypothetical protein L195_g044899 [Trifolium pratense]|uniref:Uncharacterized protein n=1 Tax=Trifolium pratense TaxID=57577 RepID=A0A2K3MDC0_TRIPR|nr:hypothetical protein L195_g044899 [Trifolium pratense]
MYWEAFKAMQLADEQLQPYVGTLVGFFGEQVDVMGPAFNALGAAMSTLYLAIKYPLDNGGVGTVRGDQLLVKRYYESSLKIRHMASNSASMPNQGQPPGQGSSSKSSLIR